MKPLMTTVKRDIVPVVEEQTFSLSAKSLKDQKGTDVAKNQALALIVKYLQSFKQLRSLVSDQPVDFAELLPVAVLMALRSH